LGRKPGMPKITEKPEFKIAGLSIDDTSFVAVFEVFILTLSMLNNATRTRQVIARNNAANYFKPLLRNSTGKVSTNISGTYCLLGYEV
jgi:hypothetical protein